MLVKDMASGNLVVVHIMGKIYWQKDLVFGKGPTQSIITLLSGSSNARIERSYRNFLVWLPYHLTSVTSLAKFCHPVPNLRPIEMFGYLAVSFVDD